MSKICDECETVSHCSEHGCIPKQQALDKMAENARELGLDYELQDKDPDLIEQSAQQEPVAWKWQPAPIRTAWGDEMVVASVAIDKDHTVCLYCERDQTPKVDAMFAQRTWVEVEQVKWEGNKLIAKLKEKNNG